MRTAGYIFCVAMALVFGAEKLRVFPTMPWDLLLVSVWLFSAIAFVGLKWIAVPFNERLLVDALLYSAMLVVFVCGSFFALTAASAADRPPRALERGRLAVYADFGWSLCS